MSGFNKKTLWLGAVFIIIVSFLVWQFAKDLTFAEPLSEAAAAGKVKELYEGEIVEVTGDKDTYRITIKLDKGIYEVEVDRETGEIGNMAKSPNLTAEDQNEADKEKKPNPSSTPTADEQKSADDEQQQKSPDQDKQTIPKEPSNNLPRLLTEKEAIRIALSKVNGEVDDVDRIQSGGVSYYLVEIEREEGEDATVQINAISGEVKNIIWDD